MSGLVKLLLTSGGRIDRATFWVSTVVLFVTGIVIRVLLFRLNLAQTRTAWSVPQGAGNGEIQITAFQGGLSPWASLLLWLLLAVPLTVLAVKRRHDRDSRGIDVIVFAGLAVLAQLPILFGRSDDPAFLALRMVLLVSGVVLLILLGVLRGTRGPNRFGPDPLHVRAADDLGSSQG